jgi:hypothetical protein
MMRTNQHIKPNRAENKLRIFRIRNNPVKIFISLDPMVSPGASSGLGRTGNFLAVRTSKIFLSRSNLAPYS